MKTVKRMQKGFMAILAIVLLVLFALIGVYMSTQVTTSALGTAATYSSIQAWFTARSATEWAAYQALHGTCSNTAFSVDGFAVTVECTPSLQITGDGQPGYFVYDLSVTAVRGSPGDVIYVSRQSMTSVTNGQ